MPNMMKWMQTNKSQFPRLTYDNTDLSAFSGIERQSWDEFFYNDSFVHDTDTAFPFAEDDIVAQLQHMLWEEYLSQLTTDEARLVLSENNWDADEAAAKIISHKSLNDFPTTSIDAFPALPSDAPSSEYGDGTAFIEWEDVGEGENEWQKIDIAPLETMDDFEIIEVHVASPNKSSKSYKDVFGTSPPSTVEVFQPPAFVKRTFLRGPTKLAHLSSPARQDQQASPSGGRTTDDTFYDSKSLGERRQHHTSLHPHFKSGKSGSR